MDTLRSNHTVVFLLCRHYRGMHATKFQSVVFELTIIYSPGFMEIPRLMHRHFC